MNDYWDGTIDCGDDRDNDEPRPPRGHQWCDDCGGSGLYDVDEWYPVTCRACGGTGYREIEGGDDD